MIVDSDIDIHEGVILIHDACYMLHVPKTFYMYLNFLTYILVQSYMYFL